MKPERIEEPCGCWREVEYDATGQQITICGGWCAEHPDDPFKMWISDGTN